MREVSDEVQQAMSALATELGATGVIHINVPIVCDHCRDDNKEAFPYDVYDAAGRHWRHLCNDCFDSLGCSYDEGAIVLDATD